MRAQTRLYSYRITVTLPSRVIGNTFRRGLGQLIQRATKNSMIR